jgi:hypothetical protein
MHRLMLASSQLYLFTTHITRNKIIAGIALIVVVVLGLAYWLMRRRRSRA